MPKSSATFLPWAAPLPLVGVLLLALTLRIWGLTWGLPSATHYFSYHPDESVVLEASSSPAMNVFAGRLLPHFYRYGSLQLYLVCFGNTLAALAGAIDIVPKNLAVWYPQWAKMYLVGRCLTVGMGVGTVFAVCCIGERLWGRRAGLLAALALAVMPLHAQHSHFLTVDVPATFWSVLSLLWSVRLATGDAKPLRAALWAGAFAGLAAATKYNLALAILPLVVAGLTPAVGTHPAASGNPPGSGGRGVSEGEPSVTGGLDSLPSRFGRGGELVSRGGFLALGLTAFVLAFFLACPGAILENTTFLRDLRVEAVHVQNADDPTFRDTGSGFVYHVARNLDAGLGLPLLVLALASVGFALYKREHGDGLLGAFALPYYVLISLAAVRYARYTIPLLPLLALWMGRMTADWSHLPRVAWRRSALVAAAVVLLATLVNGASLVSVMATEDTREEALYWLNSYAPAPARIGFAAQPWFGTAPVSPYFAMPRPGGWRTVTPPEIQKRIVYAGKNWDAASLRSAKPDVVVLSEYEYDDALRLHNQDAVAYLASLKRGYQLVAGFSPLLSTLDGSAEREGLPSRDLPHDMMYPSPEIVIYSRTRKGMQRSE
jgi:hypothetical protein